jgi:hypothetical protein
MHRLALVALAGLLATPLVAAEKARAFGKPLEGLPAAQISDLIAKPQDGQRVRLEGEVERVCQSQGCWLELRQGKDSIHVTLEGHSYFLPKDSAGEKAALEGVVVVKEPKADVVEHLQAEGAKSAASKVSIEASGVELRGK